MKLHFIAAALAAVATLPAQAVLINDAAAIAGATTVVDFEAFDGLLGSGPVNVAPGVVFSGDSGAELGANVRDLGDNGVWGVGNLFAAGGVAGELRFTFTDGLSSAAGAFVSHYANSSLPFALAIEVSAYGDNSQIIETHTFTVGATVDDYNAGQFVGISRAEADIRTISFKGVGVVADNLLAVAAPVPEPGTYLLMGLGLALVAGVARRRQS